LGKTNIFVIQEGNLIDIPILKEQNQVTSSVVQNNQGLTMLLPAPQSITESPTLAGRQASSLLAVAYRVAEVQQLTDFAVGDTKNLFTYSTSEMKQSLLDATTGDEVVAIVYDNEQKQSQSQNLFVFAAFKKSSYRYNLVLSAKILPENAAYDLSHYGENYLEIRWRDSVTLFAQTVLFKPPHQLKPYASYICRNTRDNSLITKTGEIIISSKDDPRSTPTDPIFIEFSMTYSGSAISLPTSLLPDSVITMTPMIEGFISSPLKRIFFRSEVNPTQAPIYLQVANIIEVEWRVVLSWGAEPKDLDLYCFTDFIPKEVLLSYETVK
jgi:hypothetical protein